MPVESPTVLGIDRWGMLSVATIDVTGNDQDVGFSSVGNGMLVPGSPVAVMSVKTTLWVLMIDQAGCLSAASADISSIVPAWVGPVSIGSPVFVPGSRVRVFEQSPGSLTALAVDRSGLLSACTLQPGANTWQGPIGIGANTLMPGATVAVYAENSTTFLVLAIDRAGALNVARLSTEGTPAWTGPDSVGNSMFMPGGHLTVFGDGLP
jgi:hypothetical protein